MRAIQLGTAIVVLGSLVGCATAFTGSAHVEEGRAGCEKKCSEGGMELAGMVFMGEYSDACVCEMKGKGSAAARDEMLLGAAGAGGGGAGVWMQTIAAREAHH